MHLVSLLQLEDLYIRKRYAVPAEERLALLLYRLCFPSRCDDDARVFGRYPAIVSSIQTDIARGLASRWRRKLAWNTSFLTTSRLQGYIDVLYTQAGVRRVWGFVDGVTHDIGRPESYQREYYSGYTKTHYLNYLGIATPDRLFVSLAGPSSRRWSDIAVLRESGIIERLREVSISLYILRY